MMNSVGTPWLWGSFAAVIVVMLAIDLLLQGRKGAHTMSMKQAASWSLVWVSLSLLFNFGFWYYLNETAGRASARISSLPASPTRINAGSQAYTALAMASASCASFAAWLYNMPCGLT